MSFEGKGVGSVTQRDSVECEEKRDLSPRNMDVWSREKFPSGVVLTNSCRLDFSFILQKENQVQGSPGVFWQDVPSTR